MADPLDNLAKLVVDVMDKLEKKVTSRMKDVADKLDQNLTKALTGLDTALKEAGEGFKIAAEWVGKKMNDALGFVRSKLQTAITAVTGLWTTVVSKITGLWTTMVGAVAGPLAIAIGAVGKVVGPLATIVSAVAVSGAKMVSAVAVMGARVVAGVAGFGAKAVGKVARPVGRVIAKVTRPVGAAIGAIAGPVGKVLGNIAVIAANVVGKIGAAALPVIGRITSVVAGVIGGVATVAAGVIGKIAAAAIPVIAKIGSVVAGVIGKTVGFAATAVGKIGGVVGGVIAGVTGFGGISKEGTKIGGLAGRVGKKIGRGIRGAPRAFVSSAMGVGNVTDALSSFAKMLTETTDKMSIFVAALAPGLINQYNYAVRSLQATIGTALAPAFQVLSRMIMQVSGVIYPLMKQLAPILEKLAEAFVSTLVPVIMIVTAAIRTVIGMITKSAGGNWLQGLQKAVEWVVRGLILLSLRIASLFGSDVFDAMKKNLAESADTLAKGGTGAAPAPQNVQTSQLEDIMKKMAEAAVVAGGGPPPHDPLMSMAADMKTLIANVPDEASLKKLFDDWWTKTWDAIKTWWTTAEGLVESGFTTLIGKCLETLMDNWIKWLKEHVGLPGGAPWDPLPKGGPPVVPHAPLPPNLA